DLSQALADFGLLAAPRLPLNTETPPPEPLADLALAGIGQDTLTVTPLQVARALAALATNGRLPPLQLVTAVQDAAGAWQAVAVVDVEEETAVSPQTAQTTRDLLPVAGETPGFGGREHAVLVLSGPEGSTNAWYLGLYPAAAPRYVLVIVLEGAESVARAVENGRGLLRAVTD
ncbi:MAG: hypothetical protein KC425_08970, partial [Anaerolineales bacterium]|nr:hypothetical protein [Anaerolineales bacterium]